MGTPGCRATRDLNVSYHVSSLIIFTWMHAQMVEPVNQLIELSNSATNYVQAIAYHPTATARAAQTEQGHGRPARLPYFV